MILFYESFAGMSNLLFICVASVIRKLEIGYQGDGCIFTASDIKTGMGAGIPALIPSI